MLKVNHSIDERLGQLTAWYGDGRDGAGPTVDQWRRILDWPAGQPITLINFFKLRQAAEYPAGDPDSDGQLSGQQAFERYSTVSIPTMERVGGKFLLVGPAAGMFLGEEEDWDLVAVGTYPDSEPLLHLFEDAGYRAVYHHRTAACARQMVLVCEG